MNLDFLKNSFDFFFSIFDNFDYSEEILENYSEKLEKISNLELPQINKKVLDIILLNIFNEKLWITIQHILKMDFKHWIF